VLVPPLPWPSLHPRSGRPWPSLHPSFRLGLSSQLWELRPRAFAACGVGVGRGGTQRPTGSFKGGHSESAVGRGRASRGAETPPISGGALARSGAQAGPSRRSQAGPWRGCIDKTSHPPAVQAPLPPLP
jgi:hypothetical protein